MTASYKADRDKVIEVLNEVLATEIVCTLRYKNHYYMAKGIHSEAWRRSSSSTPTRSSSTPTWSRSGSPSSAATRTSTPTGSRRAATPSTRRATRSRTMIREDLVAERIAVATYSEIMRWLANEDPTTRRLMEEILAKEEEHADDLAKLLVRIGGHDGH